MGFAEAGTHKVGGEAKEAIGGQGKYTHICGILIIASHKFNG